MSGTITRLVAIGVALFLVPRAASADATLWSPSTTPPGSAAADTAAVELGVRFRTDSAGVITGLRFYKYATNTGTHVASLWTNAGVRLATATFTGETASGWQQVSFASPIAVDANTVYVASYHTDTGRYANTAYYFTSGLDNAPLHAPADGAGGANGVYKYGASAFPTQTYHASNYWIDVVFAAAAPPPPPAGAAASIWNGGAIAATGADADSSPVEVGVRFRADANGFVTGVKFYKFASNTGTHIGSLWTNTGTRLAVATFVNEGTSGWQQVQFATPVAVAANTTYVASYHTDTGHYASSPGYFSSGVDTPPLHALASGADGPNGLYRYGSTPGFPNQSYQASNYWVDVVFEAALGDTTPPAVASAADLHATFSEPMNAATITGATIELRDPAGTPVAASVAYASPSATATVYPGAPLAAGTAYTVTIRGGATGVKDVAGNAMPADYSWSFTTAAAAPPATGCPCTIWGPAATPALADADSSAVEVGVRFRADAAGYITGVRFYKVAANGGTHIGNLWTSSGTLLARATFVGETASGWQQVAFSPPVAIAANATYVASYHMDGGHYGASPSYFTAGTDNGPLHALRDGADGANGVYKYGAATSFPTQSYRSTNYWVDVVFATALADTTAPGVYGVTPSAGATGIAPTRVVTATFNEMMAPASFTSGAFTLRDPSGAAVPAWVLVGGETPTVSLTPNAPLLNGTTYTATVRGGTGGVTDLAGNAMAANFSWSFTTAAAPGTCPCTIWTDASTPAAADTDMSAVEIGVKFRSTTPGYVTALRFYKFGTNTGTHVGSLWTRSGTRLATAVFTNESASGWQQITLPAPVAIAANTTYIASYHAPSGRYAVNGNYFSAGVTNGPLRALASGEDGGNGVYRYGPAGSFPTQTYQAANYWVDVVFDTMAPPAPTDPPAAPSGRPIVLVTSASNPFTRYTAEILRAEGLNGFDTIDVASVSAATLAGYDVALLGDMPLTAAQAAMFGDWVNGGGNLIAMKPDAKLAGLLGLTAAGSTLEDAYVAVDATTAPGAGIAAAPLQFHGPADLYTPAGATTVAMLYASPSASTSHPAVTVADVGANGGHAAAFTFDLARSIVYTRQGNPAWAAQDRDGAAPIQPVDLFHPDWVDLDNAAIPQADEQQRLLVNLVLHLNRGRTPLPRFWYLPRGLKAAVVMTGDDRGIGVTAPRFDALSAYSPAGCSTASWECVRATSYVSPATPVGNAAAYAAAGWEIAPQVDTGCANWTAASLPALVTDQIAAFASAFPGVPAPATHRARCSVWSDYATMPLVESARGLRLDTSYDYTPSSWVLDRPGFFTGSGLPMRFADASGAAIDAYQAPAQLTDSSGQSYPFTIDALLDKALGPEGYYGVFAAHIASNLAVPTPVGAIVASALTRGVPVIAARQLLEWLDGRNGSWFTAFAWNNGTLSFSIVVGSGATGLQAMLPASSAAGRLTSITRNGSPLAFTFQTIKGTEYAIFEAGAGAYQAVFTR